MDRTLLEQKLALAEKHLLKAQAHVKRQREIVAELERDGHDSKLASRILATFEQLWEFQNEERDRLIETLVQGRSEPINR